MIVSSQIMRAGLSYDVSMKKTSFASRRLRVQRCYYLRFFIYYENQGLKKVFFLHQRLRNICHNNLEIWYLYKQCAVLTGHPYGA